MPASTLVGNGGTGSRWAISILQDCYLPASGAFQCGTFRHCVNRWRQAQERILAGKRVCTEITGNLMMPGFVSYGSSGMVTALNEDYFQIPSRRRGRQR